MVGNARKHLRKNLQILTLTSNQDKEEIEARVMADIEGVVASVSDFDLDHGYSPSSFESDADTLALGIIQEQDWPQGNGAGILRYGRVLSPGHPLLRSSGARRSKYIWHCPFRLYVASRYTA